MMMNVIAAIQFKNQLSAEAVISLNPRMTQATSEARAPNAIVSSIHAANRDMNPAFSIEGLPNVHLICAK